MGEENTPSITAKNLQWHPAFYAGLQIEFAAERDKLIFENEHHLGTKPKQIDVLIIKKDDNTSINKNLGRIFRKHNIIEYKSPSDKLNIDDFYTVYAYACLYKSDTNSVNNISVEDITITFVCSHYPRKLINHWKKVRNYNVKFVEKGIYYVEGDFFPIQLLFTHELTNEQNLWLHNLTNRIHDSDTISTLLSEYEKHQHENYYQSVMNIITVANMEKFEEVTGMCQALADIYLKYHKEEIEQQQQEAIDKAVNLAITDAVEEAVAKAVEEAVTKAVEEKDALLASQEAYIKNLEAQLGILPA